MSQQSAIVQTTNASSDMTPVLGTLQSVGPNNQSTSISHSVQTSGTTTTTTVPQTQSQQTQYISQSPKQVLQQSSTPSSFNSDFPQVRSVYNLLFIVCKIKLIVPLRLIDPIFHLIVEKVAVF